MKVQIFSGSTELVEKQMNSFLAEKQTEDVVSITQSVSSQESIIPGCPNTTVLTVVVVLAK
jgi:hypothetical protein